MKRYVIWIIACSLLFACSKQNMDGVPQGIETGGIGFQRGKLTNSRYNCELDVNTVRATCDSIAPQLLQYGVKCYRIDYYTLFEDSPVQASALIIIPQVPVGSPGAQQSHGGSQDAQQGQEGLLGTQQGQGGSRLGTDMKLAVYCHGTNVPIPIGNGSKMFSDYPGPGKGYDYNEIRTCALPLAGAGFCTLVPEYTGYGFTDDQDHPFVYFPELCKSVIDGIFAAREFLRESGIEPGKDLFLSGWSQGAGASIATQKYLQEGWPDEFNIVSNSCLSGPYNIVHFMENLFSRQDEASLNVALYAWACYTINRFAPGLNRPADQIFCHNSPDQISSFLGTGITPATVFRPFFIKGVLDKTDTSFCKALQQDSFHTGWVPQGRIYLHHGTDDPLVPYFNSEDAKAGLDPDNKGTVSLIPYPGGGHDTCVGRYMTATIKAFTKDADGNAID